MGFFTATRVCLSKYFVFSGRATRPEYWWFFLFAVLVGGVASIADVVLFDTDTEAGGNSGPLSSVFQLLVFIPLLAAGWRRLHDTGRPGWYLLLPVALSLATTFLLLGGIAIFSALETGVDDPDTLRKPAAFLGGIGMFAVLILQVVLAVLMIWWLTRPSQEGTNNYGPPAA